MVMANVTRTPRKRRLAVAALIVVVVGSVAVANLPVNTRQGVNYKVSAHRIPLYIKGLEFIDRDAQYRQLAQEIAKGLTSDQERVLAAFDWTQGNIRPTPAGWPIVDDHILNVIIRGHGTGDQRADVFAMLATYAGVPAFWRRIRDSRDGVVLTFAQIDGRWVVFDVANGLVFRNSRGTLATLSDLAANPGLAAAVAGPLTIGSTPYAEFVSRLRTPETPKPLRAELQMVWPRLWHETKVALHLERGDDGLDR